MLTNWKRGRQPLFALCCPMRGDGGLTLIDRARGTVPGKELGVAIYCGQFLHEITVGGSYRGEIISGAEVEVYGA